MTENRIREIFREASAVLAATADRSGRAIGAAAEAIQAALEAGGKVVVFGNGGSAADSQHFAAELVGRFRFNRRALAAVALTTDTSIITSVANDFGFEQVFARQLAAIGRPGDVAFGITTSGRSRNVLEAFRHAMSHQMTSVALVGSEAGDIEAVADITITVPADSTPRIQEVHRTALHAICELVEDHFVVRSSDR
jgi:D-sedoheptulose 7-phosphate isomerase